MPTPFCNEVLKAVTSTGFNASQHSPSVIGLHVDPQAVDGPCRRLNIILDDVSLTELHSEGIHAAACEAKQIAAAGGPEGGLYRREGEAGKAAEDRQAGRGGGCESMLGGAISRNPDTSKLRKLKASSQISNALKLLPSHKNRVYPTPSSTSPTRPSMITYRHQQSLLKPYP